ncbi:MAG: HEAT repeat domain-containing protein [Planctomycetota bacterium]
MKRLAIALALGLLCGQDVEELVGKLRSGSLTEREKATEDLIAAGKDALPDVKKLLDDPDPEVAARAALIVEGIKIHEALSAEFKRKIPGVAERLAAGGDSAWTRALLEAVAPGVSAAEADLVFLAPRALAGIRKPGAFEAVTWGMGDKRLQGIALGLADALKIKDENLRRVALALLAHFAVTETAPGIIEALDDENQSVRHDATKALNIICGKAGAAELVAAWKNAGVLERALRKLLPNLYFTERSRGPGEALFRALAPCAKEIAPLLVPMIREEQRTRWGAVDALCWLDAKEAAADIVPMLKDDDIEVRLTAEYTIRRLGGDGAVPGLVPLLEDEDWIVRFLALRLIRNLRAKEAMPALVPLLKDENGSIRVAAFRALRRSGFRDEKGELPALLKDKNSEVRLAALRVLVDLVPPQKAQRRRAVGRKVFALLKDENRRIRRLALRYVLERPAIGKGAKDLIPLLKEEVSCPVAIEGLLSLKARDATPHVVPLLESPDPRVRRSACDALRIWIAGGNTREILPLLKDDDPHVRWSAVATLGSFGNAVIAPKIIPLLEDKEARLAALEALRRIPARAAAGDILPLLDDPDWRVREAAAFALGDLRAKEAADKLLVALQDPEACVRRAAYESLRWLSVSCDRPPPSAGRAPEGPRPPTVEEHIRGTPLRKLSRTRLPQVPLHPGTEDAVLLHLRWLARHQNMDGSWSVTGYANNCWTTGRCTPAPGTDAYDIAVTGLSLFCFLEAGYSHLSKDEWDGICFGDVVRDGAQFLMSLQRPDGIVGAANARRCFFNHLFATLALSEMYGLTGSNLFKESANRAYHALEKEQNRDGGWGDLPGRSDAVATGLALLVSRSANLSGIPTDKTRLGRAREWLRLRTCPETQRVGYRDRGIDGAYIPSLNEDFPSLPAPTALRIIVECLWDRKGKGWKKSPEAKAAAELLTKDAKTWFPGDRGTDYFAVWLKTLALRMYDGRNGPAFRSWVKSVREHVLRKQQSKDKGCRAGCWEPDDKWSCVGGRVYATAMCAMALTATWGYHTSFEGW